MPRLRLAALAALALVGLATAHAPALQPGLPLEGGCSLGFVFDSLRTTGDLVGKVWFGTAASCATVGEWKSTAGHQAFGRVVHVDPVADLALVEVREELHPQIEASVLGHPGFPRYAPAEASRTSAGDRLAVPSLAGAPREAVLVTDDASRAALHGALSPAEAGAPIVHRDSGRALAMLSGAGTYCCAGPLPIPAHIGATIVHLEAKLATQGYLVKTRAAG